MFEHSSVTFSTSANGVFAGFAYLKKSDDSIVVEDKEAFYKFVNGQLEMFTEYCNGSVFMAIADLPDGTEDSLGEIYSETRNSYYDLMKALPRGKDRVQYYELQNDIFGQLGFTSNKWAIAVEKEIKKQDKYLGFKEKRQSSKTRDTTSKKKENKMEKIYVNQEGLVMIVSKEDKPVNPIANFVEFCPLQCREKEVFFISNNFEMMNLEVPKGAKAFQMVYFVEKAGKLQAVKSTKRYKGKVLGFAFTAEEMSEKELIELVNDDLSVFQEYLDGKVYHVVMTDIDECEEDIIDNIYEDSKSTKGHPLMLALKKKKKGKKLYRSQLDDDFDPEVLPWVETKRDKDGYILSWQEVFDEE